MSVRKGSNYIAGNNVAVDGNTVTQDANNSLQAIGTKNKNTANGAEANIYDWVGTLDEYTQQDVANLHPEWVCYITDDNVTQSLNLPWVSGLGMPNTDRYLDLTVLASGSEYIAPANGWFFACGTYRSGASICIVRLSNTTNPDAEMRTVSWCSGASGREVSVFLPVKAGDSVSFTYGAYTNNNLKMTFFHTVGNGQ